MNNRRNFVRKAFWTLTGLGLLPSLHISGSEIDSMKIEPQGPADEDEDLQKIAEFLRGKAPIKWIFSGDSITQGAKHTFGDRSYPEIFSERVRWELGRVRD